jgi:hypothetical protein
MRLKINYFGILAGVTAVVSLFLPWFTIELWTENLGSTMSFAANLFQLTGTVEGVTKSIFLVVWFNVGAFVLMLVAGLACLTYGIFSQKRRTFVFAVSCALAFAALLFFGFGLATSSFAVESINPGYTISQFPEGSFGLSAEESMRNSYEYSWAVGVGFWLALVTAISAMLAAFLSRRST